MNLQAQLDEYKANFKKTAPTGVQKIMSQAAEELRNSAILEQVLKKGDQAPDFALENAEGQMVRSEDILSQRTMVLTFYRGRW